MVLPLSQLLLGVALASAGIAAIVIPLMFLPSSLPDTLLRGYRASRRRTALAESPLLQLAWPLIRLFTYYAERLPLATWKQKKSILLRNAGEPWGLSPDEFLGLILFSTGAGAAFSVIASSVMHMGFGVIIMGTFLGFILPQLWLTERAQHRLHAINSGLPQALDMIVLSMGAGLDFIGAVRHVVDQWRDLKDPLYEELSRFFHELSLGKSRREALEDLARRSPTELVRAFVTNAVESEKRGTPLVEILEIQAQVARTRRFQLAERSAGRAGVVILLPLMFIFAATILVMFGGLIVKGFRGRLF